MKLRISGKLFAGFGLTILLTVLISVIAFFQLKSVDSDYTHLLEDETVRIEETQQNLIKTQNMIIAARGYLYTKNPSYLQEYENAKTSLDNQMKKMEETLQTEEDRKIFGEIDKANKSYIEIFDAILLAAKSNQDFSHLSKAAAEAYTSIMDTNGDMVKLQQENLELGKTRVQSDVSGAVGFISIISIISIIAAVAIAVFTSKLITVPLVKLDIAAKDVAQGDLSKEEINITNKDEIGDLGKSFNIMVQNLKQLILEVNTSSQNLASSAQELSASAEQTSSAANESANTVSEMANGIQQIAVNSQAVAEVAMKTSILAEEGSQGVEDGVSQMQVIKEGAEITANTIMALEEKSKSISQIVELITHIADQTNLLALNAAIEAARAGEQGRGFAVVAEEVRKLAEQSANAAKEITDIINEIQDETADAVEAMGNGAKQVEDGTKVIGALGENFNNILSMVRNLSTRVQEVSAASQQMAASVENVAAATEEQTAAMEEVTASSESLTSMADGLQTLISRFKL